MGKKRGGFENDEKWQLIVEIFAQRCRLRKRGERLQKIKLRARILMGASSLFNM